MIPVSVVFTTHNRKDLLKRAISAVLSQTIETEIIVMDDASIDDTNKMIESEFPQVKYERSSINLGPSYQRNKGAGIATSEIIFFLDDDTILQDIYTFEAIIKDFLSSDIGVVTIPFINILQDNLIRTGAPDKVDDYIYHAFVAAAFAVKRNIFLKIGGFRKEYFYMGEEGDFCIRLLNAGYYVKAGTSKPAFHYQPPKRVSFNPDYYGRRNDILFVFLNCPRKFMLFYLTKTILKCLFISLRPKHTSNMLKGTWAGLMLLKNNNIAKLITPIKSSVYFKYRYIKQHEPIKIKKIKQKYI